MNQIPARPAVAVVGANDTPIWGMTVVERTRRIAGKAGLPFVREGEGARLLVNAAFAFDPPLLAYLADRPGVALMRDGTPAIVHVADPADAEATRRWIAGRGDAPHDLAMIVHDAAFTLYNDQLRKREQPFLAALTPASVRGIERQSYFAAYKGVTDILTKYLWPEWALVLTRLAARIGMTPNMVTGVGAVLCVAAFFLFRQGHYWPGMAAGLVFMVLDTVDGKLARCTISSSAWGNAFDHGIDLVHPPFWYWAWAVGLGAWGLALSAAAFWWIMAAILVGYVAQRMIEGAFIKLYGIHIHIWERTDSRFRLVTARRNPNMVLLFAGVLLRRPDIGLIAVAWWTVLSLLFHAVRLAQAFVRARRGEPVRSWLQG